MTCSVSSPLNGNQFTLTFPKIKNVTIYLQKVNLPGLTLSSSEIGTPFSFMKEPDTKLRFNDLNCTFLLDENFSSYLEIYNWMKGLGFPTSFTEYSNLKGQTIGRENLISDAILNIYNNSSNPNIEVKFNNIFPTFLSDLNFDITIQDSYTLDVQASFAYDYHNINKIS